jgi:pimeloyl-ACP methyl ester carboxylesterase
MKAVLKPRQRMIEAGNGEMVLFLHGAGGFPAWFPFFEALSQDYRLLMPEHPNFGASDEAPDLRTVSDYAYYYLDFLEALDVPRVHVVGHSLGGWISAEMAVRDSSRFASLTLLAPAGARVKGHLAGDNFIWSPEESVRKLFHDPALQEQILAIKPTEAQQEEMVRSRLIAARLGWEPRWFNPALPKWLHRIKAPTLLVWGEDDALLPAAWSAAWKEAVPRLRHVPLPACGHSPHIEKTAAVLDAMRPFLQENRA